MGSRHILSIPAANDGDPVVVVEVTASGKQPLDVRLVGCEGENGYVAELKQRSIGNLRKHNFKGSDEEWEALLSYVLLQKQPEASLVKVLDDVRVAYVIKGEKLEISIRRDVQGIKVTLGEVILEYNEEEEIEPFAWAQVSAQAHASVLEEIARLKADFSSKQNTIDKLNAQLEDFIKAKNEAETAMLRQFMELLNEKKRKIRDQNRLLAGAKVDKAAASAVTTAREETKPRKAGPSRTSKRKAPAKALIAEQEEESHHMEVDEVKEEDVDEESAPEAATPDRGSDDETEDEGDASISAESQSRSASAGVATKPTPVTKTASPPKAPPPVRELPFHRSTTRSRAEKKNKQPSPPAEEDDDTEDEL